MTDSLEALRGYVHFLRERDGVRQAVRLSRTARQGLAQLAGEVKPSFRLPPLSPAVV